MLTNACCRKVFRASDSLLRVRLSSMRCHGLLRTHHAVMQSLAIQCQLTGSMHRGAALCIHDAGTLGIAERKKRKECGECMRIVADPCSRPHGISLPAVSLCHSSLTLLAPGCILIPHLCIHDAAMIGIAKRKGMRRLHTLTAAWHHAACSDTLCHSSLAWLAS